MIPRPPNEDIGQQSTPRHTFISSPDYENVSFRLLSGKVFDIKVNVSTAKRRDPTHIIKTQAWDLTSVYMVSTQKWSEIIEALQDTGQIEFPFGRTFIDESSPFSATINIGDYQHSLIIASVRRALS